MSLRSLVSRRSHDPFLALNDEFSRVFNGFLNGGPVALLERDGFSPRINVTEDEKSITVSAELPGVDEKDIDLSLEDGVLTIQGEKKSVSEDKSENTYRSERFYGSFGRAIRLPSEVDDTKVTAGYEQGVLTVELPKTDGGKRKTIAVSSK